MVISHGFTFQGRYDDTWALDLDTNEWSDISPEDSATRPLKRCPHDMVWLDADRRMLLYGGCSSGFGPCPQGDLWVFNPVARTWTDITPQVGPAARSNPALALDATGRVVLFGGTDEANLPLGDSWGGTYGDDGFVWTAVESGEITPPARASTRLALIDTSLVMVGGRGADGPLADV